MLYNTLASEQQLLQTPSGDSHVPKELEYRLRAHTCRLIQQTGVLLKLPQRTMAVAQVLFHRFWFVSSLQTFSLKDIAMGALFLSTKLEETPVRLRHLINAFDYTLQKNRHWTAEQKFVYKPSSLYAQQFYDMKDALVVAEMQILKRLGFSVHVILPYAMTVNYLQVLGLTDAVHVVSNRLPTVNRDPQPPAFTEKVSLAQRAWSFLNDGLQTPMYCLFPPQTIACAAIYLATKMSDPPIRLPMSPAPWWVLFDATRPEIHAVCAHLLWVYRESDDETLAHLMDKHALRQYIATHHTQ